MIHRIFPPRCLAPRLVAVALLGLVCACGAGGSGGGGGGKGPEVSLEPYPGPLTDEDIRHFLSRTHFASSEAGVTAVKTLGLPVYVDTMLTFQSGTQVEADALGQVADPDWPTRGELKRYWLYLAQKNPNAFQENLALFWHNHFVVSQENLRPERYYWYFDYIDLLRQNGVENLRTLIYFISIDWSMLAYLDGTQSTASKPNENFARELWELFTLGRDVGYAQEDIEEASRAFTGYRRRTIAGGREIVEFDETLHDATDKVIFGQTIKGQTGTAGALEYLAVANLTIDNRPVAEFLCRRIFEYFCYEDAPDSIIEDMAEKLRQDNYEVKELFRTLFLSKAFYSARAREGIVKSPVEYVIGFLRTTGLEIPMKPLEEALEDAGQVPSLPPDVNGWPGGAQWLSPDFMVERANAIIDIINDRNYQASLGIEVTDLLPPAGQRSATAVVDALVSELNVKPTGTDLSIYVSYLNTDRDSTGTVFTDLFDETDPDHVEARVRGLLYILAQHPSYHLR